MRKRIVLRASSLFIGLAGLAGALSAQTNLNRNPSRAVGQPQLAVNTRNPNLVEGRELYAPQGLALDNSVNPPVLYVSDFWNNRVLAWKNALAFSNGAKADFVIGQKDLYSTAAGGPGTPFSTGLLYPTGLAVDRGGNLYVIDAGNNRILRFPKPYTQTDQFPDLVIGQTSLNCSTCRSPNPGGITAKTIYLFSNSIPAPFSSNIIFDAQGNLWFTDSGNNRVLRYAAADIGPTASNAPAASLVLGQLAFDTNTLPTGITNEQVINSKTILYQPTGLVFDPAGRLYVSDSTDRVLVFQPNLSPQTFDNGRAALRIVGLAPISRPGQLIPKPNQYQFSSPSGVFMVGTSLGVVDTGNNRLMLFGPFGDSSWPADTSLSPPAKPTGFVGQPGFSGNKPNRDASEPRINSLNAPAFALATSTELFVSDTGNHRVLVFSGVASLDTNSVATRVLGQDDFVFGAPNLLEGREMNFSPVTGGADGGVWIDTTSDVPHLYIADTFNNRVLGYRDVRQVRPGDKADLVIGQPDFQRSLINYPSNDRDKPSAQSLYLPVGLTLDSAGNLFVADSGNGRVLRFPRPFDQAQPNFPSADLVLGQSSLTSTRVIDPTQRTMRNPYGLAFTSDGGLLVSDSALNRVLFFPGKSEDFVNGMSASKVFGQPDFFSFQSGSETNEMNSPKHIASDSDDRIYVADEGNNRLLIFDNVLFSAGNNARAGTILTGPTANGGFGAVRGVFVNKITGEFWVTEVNQNRVLRFPKFDDLPFQQNASNLQIGSNAGVAVTQDSFGDLFVAEFTNRIAIYYPGLTAMNAANVIKGRALAPGAIVTASQQGGTLVDDVVVGDPTNWPLELADTQILVNDSPAPIRDVKPFEINFLMPMSTPSSGSVEVQLVRKSTGQILGAGQVDMAPASPALFTRNGFGTGQLVANNDDGSANEPSHPLGRGKVISLFGTGLGFVPGAPPDGQAPGEPIAAPQAPRIFMGSRFIEQTDCKPDGCIVFSGLAPGQVGVWQIDVKIPDFVAPGPLVQVLVQLRSISSSQPPQQTTIAVSQQ
ncbi:MAG TPA: hypothetical protein VL793_04820 [Patescibacteria group bacterium]|nr:hypothetical protein [Patescibacteria group bacterium]